MQHLSEKKRQYTVPNFDLPIMPERMEKDLAPKLVSFDAYLRFIANSYKKLSLRQKKQARKMKLEIHPVSVPFEWKK